MKTVVFDGVSFETDDVAADAIERLKIDLARALADMHDPDAVERRVQDARLASGASSGMWPSRPLSWDPLTS